MSLKQSYKRVVKPNLLSLVLCLIVVQFSVLAVAEGTGDGGGGLFKPNFIPKDDFLFVCKVQLADQKGRDVAYASTSFEVSREILFSPRSFQRFDLVTTDEMWKQGSVPAYNRDPTFKMPRYLKDHSISFSPFQDLDGQHKIRLFVRVSRVDGEDTISASSSGEFLFTSKNLFVEASSYHLRGNNKSNDVLLSLSVQCDKIR